MRLRNVQVVKYCGYETIVIWLQAFKLRDRCYERFNCKTFKNPKVLTNIIFRKTCFAAKTNYSNCVLLTSVAEADFLARVLNQYLVSSNYASTNKNKQNSVAFQSISKKSKFFSISRETSQSVRISNKMVKKFGRTAASQNFADRSSINQFL